MDDAGDAGMRGVDEPAPAGAAQDEEAHEDAESGGAEGADAATPTDEERVRAVVEGLRRLKVEDLALDMAVSLVTVGYQKLGLTEQTRELRDLGGARLAIEVLRALLDVLEREGATARLGDLRSTVAAMQMNYARAVAEGAEAADGAPAGEGRAAAAGDPGPAGEADAEPAPGSPEPPA